MSDSLKSLAEIQSIDDYVGVDGQQLCHLLRREMTAAVVDPVGLKAYWSENDRDGGGERKAG